jgi:selenocysteine-specific elongation factor
MARVRQMGSTMDRLTVREPVPLHVGDRVLLRDPGAGERHTGWPSVLGAVVLDVAPPPLARRGAGASAARELATWPDAPTAADLLRRHGLLRASALLAMGVSEHPEPVCGEWLADPGHWADLARRLGEAIAVQAGREPPAPGGSGPRPRGDDPGSSTAYGASSAGLSLDAARAALGLPDRRLVEALVRPPLRIRDGVVQMTEPAGGTVAAALPAAVTAAVQVLLADLPQPFTAAEARQALHTTRRVAIPLLEFLDRAGITERLPDDRRRLLAATPPPLSPPAC